VSARHRSSEDAESGEGNETLLWTRRRLIRRALLWKAGPPLAGGASVVAYGAAVAPFHPVLERVTIAIPDLPPAFDGFRIVQLSDLHVQPAFPAERLAPALARARAARPDLIVATGDYVNDRAGRTARPADAAEYADSMERCAAAFGSLRGAASCGIFASFGNHDFRYPRDPPRALWEAAGVTPLLDEVAPIERGGERLWLAGLRSFLMRPVAPGPVLARTPAKATRIVLWHEPDRADEVNALGGALQLSGHTHGGQVRLPGQRGAFVLPPGGKRFPSGRFRCGEMTLYVSRGVGLLPPMIRLNCPPEVTLLTLRRPRAEPAAPAEAQSVAYNSSRRSAGASR
jgi:hypothetical protein